jgi:nitroreductase
MVVAGGAEMSQIQHDSLEEAVRDAVRAPSVFNTQPWLWQIDAAALELRADRSRQLHVADPHGYLLLMSCGAALHHARVSLAAGGWSVDVQRMRPATGEAMLARICLVDRRAPDPAAIALRNAIAMRRTDRRPFADEPVPSSAVKALTAAVQAEGVRLHQVRLSQMPMLAIAVATAGATEMADPDYRVELLRWTNRPEWSNDGVPPATAVRKVPRRVPVREFTLRGDDAIPVTPGGDRGAVYLILHGDGLGPEDWLRAGEALSATLLTAVTLGLASAPITDVLEVEHPRDLVRGLLDGHAEPYAVVRCGYPSHPEPLPEAPRRGVDEVVQGPTVW